MFKLFATNTEHHLLQILFPNPRIHTPISHFPNCRSETTISDAKTRIKGHISDPFELQISHPWPEWVKLMKLLLTRGYFDGMVSAKEFNNIRTAGLNFARDRFDLMRYLSKKDIQVIAESGCPNLDRKVVNSGKRLRAYVEIGEGHVCSSCIIRGDCKRAYVEAREDERGRTVDVMRFLITYGLDPLTDSVKNKPSLNKKVKESVRNLLKEMVNFSTDKHGEIQSSSTFAKSNDQEISLSEIPMKHDDWICPKCSFVNFGRNIKCLRCNGMFQERLETPRENQDHLPLKKGDWICDKCNFFNFAKNTRCLQCKDNPPKRQLNPGEWECDSCNYINFRRNMVCLKCDHRRPKAFQHVPEKRECSQSRPYFGEERESKWKFVEDEREDCDKLKDVENQEQWKTEMENGNIGTMENRNIGNGCESSDELTSTSTRKKTGFLESTDNDDDGDDEIAESFGKNRK